MDVSKERIRIAKERLKLPRGDFRTVAPSPAFPAWMTRAYESNWYIVTIDDNAETSAGTAIRAMVQRVDGAPIPGHWKEMQWVKNEIFGPEVTAIEYYPAESELVDTCNIYWMWVFPEGIIPKIVQDGN